MNGAFTSVLEIEVPRGHFGLEADGWRIEARRPKVKALGRAGSPTGPNLLPAAGPEPKFLRVRRVFRGRCVRAPRSLNPLKYSH